jgi:hypothetical protein
VNDFLRYSADHRAVDADHSHVYTAEGIRLLAAALEALAYRDASADSSLQSGARAVAGRADLLQRNPASTEHARYARDAFDAAAKLMAAIPNADAASAARQMSALRTAADAVNPDVLLLQQADAVERFFSQADSTLRVLATPASA